MVKQTYSGETDIINIARAWPLLPQNMLQRKPQLALILANLRVLPRSHRNVSF